MTPHDGIGAVAAAHPLAVEAAQRIFQAGGNAVDAAIAAQAVIAVVLPQAAGLGGDMLALVDSPSEPTVAVNGTGRSPQAWQPSAQARAVGETVTVPGLVRGWFDMHHRFGRIDIAELLAPAIQIATEGHRVGESFRQACDAHRDRMGSVSPQAPPLTLEVGCRWRQPELAATLAAIASHGPDVFYRGQLAAAVVDAVRSCGGALSMQDLAEHQSQIAAPLAVGWNAGRVLVQPPSSQGVLLGMALNWLDARIATFDAEQLEHVLVEVTKSAFEHRDDAAQGAGLLDVELNVDTEQASDRRGPRAYLHTAGVATVDADGVCVSSLISVFDVFGSGIWVHDVGIVLNNRADGFTRGANAPAPGKRPVHTLAPALVVAADGSRYAIATPGADGQVQTLLQVLTKVRRGVPLADAVQAPRWRSEGGTLMMQRDHPSRESLQRRGHRVELRDGASELFGAVVSAGHDRHGLFAVADWRREAASGSV